MFEEAIHIAAARIRTAAGLADNYRLPEVAFWQHVVACCRRAEIDIRRPRCKIANKAAYSSEAVARVVAQYGAEQDTGSRVWNAYPCPCGGWHVGHGWETRVGDALPITVGYAYDERAEVRFSLRGDLTVAIGAYREQLHAALHHLGDYAFDVEGDYTPRCLWPRTLRLRVPPGAVAAASSLTELRVGSTFLRLGDPCVGALAPQTRLFARLVTSKNAMDQETLGASLAKRFTAWGGSATIAIGDRRVVSIAGSTIVGFEVDLGEMDARTSMIVQSEGLGGRTRYGCGFFFGAVREG